MKQFTQHDHALRKQYWFLGPEPAAGPPDHENHERVGRIHVLGVHHSQAREYMYHIPCTMMYHYTLRVLRLAAHERPNDEISVRLFFL